MQVLDINDMAPSDQITVGPFVEDKEPMAYSEFTLNSAIKKFGLFIEETDDLFATAPEVEASAALSTLLDEYIPLALAIQTEKARSEFIIAPILAEVLRRTNWSISLFSGVDFVVDAANGLTGVCDFIISQSPVQLIIQAPVVTIVEAKNEDVKRGLGQCVATMVAAQKFNTREGHPKDILYGVVTTGSGWRFLQLQDSLITIDKTEYYIDQVGKILGILLYLVTH